MSGGQRYIRQTSLPAFGSEGQSKLLQSSVLIVGLGGLGIPVAQYLTAMGVGTLGLVEQDLIDLHNLQRQVLYAENEVGLPKIAVALQKLKAQNPTTEFKAFDTFLTKSNALEIIRDFDIVVDATDNFATRYLINDACVILNKPFVYGALHGFEGQVSVFNHKGGATYRCLFPKQPAQEEIPNCNENGVLGVLPGIVGTLQALEVVKVITGIGEALSGKLLLFDGLTQTSQKINFSTNPKNKRIDKLNGSYEIDGCNTIQSIHAEDFLLLREKQKLQIIDVRTEREYKMDKLEGSINIPLAEIGEQWHQIDLNAPIYLLCQSGVRSQKAYKKLREIRPNAMLFNISGGLSNLKLHVGTN